MLGLYWESPETFKNELINLRVHGESNTACIQTGTLTPGVLFSHLDVDEKYQVWSSGVLGDCGWCFPHISKNPLREIVLCAITKKLFKI